MPDRRSGHYCDSIESISKMIFELGFPHWNILAFQNEGELGRTSYTQWSDEYEIMDVGSCCWSTNRGWSHCLCWSGVPNNWPQSISRGKGRQRRWSDCGCALAGSEYGKVEDTTRRRRYCASEFPSLDDKKARVSLCFDPWTFRHRSTMICYNLRAPTNKAPSD